MNTPSVTMASVRPIGAHVGWDWSDEKHDLYVRLPGQIEGRPESLPNTPEALHAWFRALPKRFASQRIIICIEASRSALLPIFLQYRDWVDVYWLNPRTLAKYRQALRPSGSKSDRLDCELAADIVIAHPEQLHRWEPNDLETAQLAIEVEQRRHLVDHRTLLANRLKSHLKNYFPQALDWLDHDLTITFAPRFLNRWPTLQALQATSPSGIRRFLRAHRRKLTPRVEELIATLPSRIPVTTAPAFLQPAVAYTAALVHQLDCLHADLRTYDKGIATLTRAHPNFQVVAELPGAGPVLMARLLAALGNDPRRYASASQLAVVAGIAPVKKSSGKNDLTLRRLAFPHFLHQTFIEFAKNSIRWSRWAGAFIQRKQQAGWGFFRAVRALAFKWIRILYALIQTGSPYDEARYEACLAKRQSTYANALPAA
jgi:transposase